MLGWEWCWQHNDAYQPPPRPPKLCHAWHGPDLMAGVQGGLPASLLTLLPRHRPLRMLRRLVGEQEGLGQGWEQKGV